jgi:hypothetical protein
MANLITAGNGTNNGLALTSDNTGALNILTGSGAGTAAISIDSSQNVTAAANLSVTGNVTVTGNLSVTGNALAVAGAIGYGTGAGGAVTQLTSRTTGVTLNKPTGSITMFTAAGSVTAATFTVTNSFVSATDTISVNQKSGTNLYVLLVTAVAAGSFNITFYTTSGIASDAPVINFNVIKGVTA